MPDVIKEEHFRRQLSRLKTERTSLDGHLSELDEYILPGAVRAIGDTKNYSKDKRNSINDNHAGLALNIASAGLMAGGSSPARPWMKLATPDPDRNEFSTVKEWLHKATQIMLFLLGKSNAYKAIHAGHKTRLFSGTSCDLMLDDFEDVTRFYTHQPGMFYLSTNHRNVVDTVYVERKMTAEQVVREYKLNAVSDHVRNAWDNGNYLTPVNVVIAIEPREKSDRDLKKKDARNMPFKSIHFESGQEKKGKLREGGFMEFPGICPRWEVFGDDVYASTCPGMEALYQIKGLQFNQESKAKVMDYGSNPPVQIPMSMKGSEDVLPGGVSYYPDNQPQGGIRTAFEVELQLSPVLEDIQDVREMINRHFFVDLFLMLANSDRKQITAREIAERHEEKLLMLGPALEQFHNELYSPIIDRLFMQALRAGLLPPIPEELEGIELKIEFISTLAQAQKLVGLGAWDRMVQSAGVLGQIFGPSTLHKFKPDNMIDSLSEMVGTDPDFIRGNEEVAVIRKAEQEAQAALIRSEQAKQSAETARNLSQADTSGQNALTDIAQAVGV